jgi:16S rRNA (guanine1516-N2)-methyltransferase
MAEAPAFAPAKTFIDALLDSPTPAPALTEVGKVAEVGDGVAVVSGLARALADPEIREIAARMHLVHGDAGRDLEALVENGGVAPEVIHLDPMFPHRDKSALVKKEMRLFRALAGDDPDAPRLLEAALDVATHRVVVKRPRKAPPLAGPPPRHVIEDKTSRYDLYVHRRLGA